MNKLVTVLSLALISMAFASCNTHQEELDAAIKKNDSLSLIIQNKDSELDSLFTTLSQIEENLAAVNSRYNAVQELRRANMEGQPNVRRLPLSRPKSMPTPRKAPVCKSSSAVRKSA